MSNGDPYITLYISTEDSTTPSHSSEETFTGSNLMNYFYKEKKYITNAKSTFISMLFFLF